MKTRHSEFDVSNTVKVSNTLAVRNAVCDIFHACYPACNDSSIRQAFELFENLFEGHYRGYQSCDTYYHDKQHTLDVSLAFARLFHGYQKQAKRTSQLDSIYMSIGIITALFHDAGYIRKQHDHTHFNGAEYTRVHVSRSASFLRDYLIKNNLGQFADTAAAIVHYTGYEVPLDKIQLKDSQFHLIGYMIGSADLIAQMADRCYLEKCRERLFPEFQLAGLTEITKENGEIEILFASADDLLIRTPDFFHQEVRHRLAYHLKNVYQYAASHFGGDNLYIMAIEKNIQHIEKLIQQNMLDSLSRVPPTNLACQSFDIPRQQNG